MKYYLRFRCIALATPLIFLFGCATPHQNISNGKFKEASDYINRPGSNLNVVDGSGETLLMKAIWKKQDLLVDLLLSKNVDPNIKSNNGNTALSLAANANEFEYAEKLIKGGANPNAVYGGGDTLLTQAVWKKQYSLVDLLLSKKADPNIESINGNTALSVAVFSNQFELADKLIKQGANPNHINKFGSNIVFTAFYTKNSSILEFSKKHKVNFNILNNAGASPLSLALYSSDLSQRDNNFAKKLIDFGAEINFQLRDGRTPLILSIESDNFEFSQYLINKGADTSISSNYKYSPIHLSISKRNSKLTAMLINESTVSTINQRNSTNNTPLILAAATSQTDLAKALVNAGAALDVMNDHGVTAMGYAAKEGNSDLTNFLLQAGANPRIGATNQDPLSVAKHHNRAEIVVILEAALGINSKSKSPNIESLQPVKSKAVVLELSSSGSGVRLSDSGHIVTNSHVINSCKEIKINGKLVQLIGEDKINDLALLKGLPGSAASIRNATEVKVGEKVLVVGFPLSGLLGSGIQANSGDISALSGIANDSRIFQISAPVNPGNSGGPLFDQKGNIIGIVRSKLDALIAIRPFQLNAGSRYQWFHPQPRVKFTNVFYFR
jgi:ankyrin repeat protein